MAALDLRLAYLVSHLPLAWRERQAGSAGRIRRIALCVTVAVLLLLTPLFALRRYQQRSAASLLRHYLELPSEPLRRDAMPLRNPIVVGAGGPAMLVDVALNMWTCPEPVAVTFQYALARREIFHPHLSGSADFWRARTDARHRTGLPGVRVAGDQARRVPWWCVSHRG